MHKRTSSTATVAVDSGGTFTDVSARVSDGRRERLKVPSTPDAPERAVLSGLKAIRDRLGPEVEVEALLHGTTVATNALLERRGARVVLITNSGLEDLLFLRRQARPELYALHPVVPPPLVRKEDCVGIEGRLGPSGDEEIPLQPLSAWLAQHAAILSSAESFAVCLLHSYANDCHEREVVSALQEH